MSCNDFIRNVNRHHCYRADGAASNPSKVYDVIQYPLMKTSEWSEGENLLNLSTKVIKGNSIQFECDVDRTLELTYCVSDILDVLITPKNGVAHTYVKMLHQYLNESGKSENASGVVLSDFKPLWAIKRSMN